MARLFNMQGQCCGNIEGAAPDGYWSRADDAPDQMTALDFLDKIGPRRFASVWTASLAHPEIAFPMVRGLAAQMIYLSESFPSLIALEQAGVLSAGTALEIWA
jgi:hypothetical protein